MNYKNYNDYELIYMVRENDENSKGILFEKYMPIIRNLAKNFSMHYPFSGYDYDDLVQEGMIAFQKALSSYDEKKDSLFYTFATICIRRRMISFVRSMTKGYREMSFCSFMEISDNDMIDEKSNLNSIIDDYEIHRICKDIIVNLSLLEGSILELKINGFSYREISILLDIPTSSVEYKSRYARKLLKKELAKYYCK